MAKYSWSVDNAARPHRAEVSRIAIVSRGGYKPAFLKSFTQFAAGTFNYRGYNCTGFYYDSSSLDAAAFVAKRIEALRPDLTIQLYMAADTAAMPDKMLRNGSVYHIDAWRGWGAARKQLANGAAMVINETDVSGADFRRITARFCREFLRYCVIYPVQQGRARL